MFFQVTVLQLNKLHAALHYNMRVYKMKTHTPFERFNDYITALPPPPLPPPKQSYPGSQQHRHFSIFSNTVLFTITDGLHFTAANFGLALAGKILTYLVYLT